MNVSMQLDVKKGERQIQEKKQKNLTDGGTRITEQS